MERPCWPKSRPKIRGFAVEQPKNGMKKYEQHIIKKIIKMVRQLLVWSSVIALLVFFFQKDWDEHYQF